MQPEHFVALVELQVRRITLKVAAVNYLLGFVTGLLGGYALGKLL